MRGVGQTTNMIYNLPNERCVVVCHDNSFARHLQNLIKEFRGQDFSKKVKVIQISSVEDTKKLLGLNQLIFFDHCFFDTMDEEIAKRALELSRMSAIIYHENKRKLK